MEIWIKERGDDALIEAALVPLGTWQELWAVADAARVYIGQVTELGPVISKAGKVLAATLDVLDGEA